MRSRQSCTSTGQRRARQAAHGAVRGRGRAARPQGRHRSGSTVGGEDRDDRGLERRLRDAPGRCCRRRRQSAPRAGRRARRATSRPPASTASGVPEATYAVSSRSSADPVTTARTPAAARRATSDRCRARRPGTGRDRGSRVDDDVGPSMVSSGSAGAPAAGRRRRPATRSRARGRSPAPARPRATRPGSGEPHVEQTARVVLRDRGDAGDAGEAQQEGRRQGALVEGGEDSRRVEPPRSSSPTSASGRGASTGCGSAAIHGASNTVMWSTPGRSAAPTAAERPAEQRDGGGAGARRRGRRGRPAARRRPSRAGRRARRSRRPLQQQADGCGEVRRPPRARRSPRAERVASRGTSTAGRRRPRAAPTSAPMSPISARALRSTPSSAQRRDDQPGRGLAAAAAVIRAVRAELDRCRTARAARRPAR